MSGAENNSGSDKGQRPLRPKHKGEKVNILEPQSTMAITSSPRILSCFQNARCFQFCEKIKQVKRHPKLTRLLILNLHNKNSSLEGEDFISHQVPYLRPQVSQLWVKNGLKRANWTKTFYIPSSKQGIEEVEKHFSLSHTSNTDFHP